MEENEKISNEAAHEILVAAMERQVKRLFILCIILFIALVGTNAYWIWNESRYEDVVTTVTQETTTDGGGDAIINGENAGAVFYGTRKADDNNESKTEENP